MMPNRIHKLPPDRRNARLSLLLAWATCLWWALCPAAPLARPTSSAEAGALAAHWLAREATPLKAHLSGKPDRTQTYKNTNGSPAYHVISLAPEGFIVVAGDDLVEPIVCFSPEGHYDPSPANPMGALVSQDLAARVARVQVRQKVAAALANDEDEIQARAKWASLLRPRSAKMDAASAALSDPRVAPLLASKWSQTVAGKNQACFNYFTPTGVGVPNNYPCGCVATAMAQLMRFYRAPRSGVGTDSFQITVDGRKKTRKLRGGNGSGGAYDWNAMPLVPSAALTQAQEKMIGALTYDAGVSARMAYRRSGSGAAMNNAAKSLKETFDYANVIHGYTARGSISNGRLQKMLNPNLDAGYPVLLAIYKDNDYGHAVVCDGYGYNGSTLYHHLNMGWSGYSDAWYNLPKIDGATPFNLVTDCIYNVYASGKGEIISGRVTGPGGAPLAGATITAKGGGKTFSATTNARGIYALAKIPSSTSFTITARKAGYTFGSVKKTTGKSSSGTGDSGNLWDVRLTGAGQANAARGGKTAVAVWRAYE
jgi:hypothetical protein